jgi:hypothetical protein
MRSSDPRRRSLEQQVDDLTMTLLGIVSPSLDFQNEEEIVDALLDEHPDWTDEQVAARARRIKARIGQARQIRGNLRDLAPRRVRPSSRSSGSTFFESMPDLAPFPRFGSRRFEKR